MELTERDKPAPEFCPPYVYDSGLFTAAIEFLLLFARGGSTAIPICATGQFAVLDLDREFRKFAWLALDTAGRLFCRISHS